MYLWSNVGCWSKYKYVVESPNKSVLYSTLSGIESFVDEAKENDATSESSFSLSFYGHLGKYNFVLGSTIC